MDGQALLTEYVRNGSETAFRELVTSYFGLVYSTALRLVGGDSHLAQDVAQMVFADLARKAHTVSSGVMLGGWLHRRTCNIAAPMMRAERRRQAREKEAVEMTALQEDSGAALARITPVLDQAITQLGNDDRTAIVLRFFEHRDFRSIGAALGTTDDAAQKRVTRALEKLHTLLKGRGVALSTAALATCLGSEALTAAPAALAASIAGTAFAAAGASGANALPLFKILTTAKIKACLIGAVVLVGVATPLVMQHQAQIRLRDENQKLRHQIELLGQSAVENERLSNLLTNGNAEKLALEKSSELLRLRGEVALLKRQLAVNSRPGASRRQEPAPSEVENYYLAHQNDFQEQESVELNLITLSKRTATSASEVEAMRKDITDIRTRLAAGADFSTEAKLHSEDRQAPNGGDYGWFQRGQLRKELEDVAFSLRQDETSQVVEGPEDFWIVRITGRRQPCLKPLAEVQDEIRKQLDRERNLAGR